MIRTYVHVHVFAYLRKIMPILEMVAGEAHDRSCDSNRKLMLGPNWILSPEGIVSSLQKVKRVKIRKRTERSQPNRRITNKGIRRLMRDDKQ